MMRYYDDGEYFIMTDGDISVDPILLLTRASKLVRVLKLSGYILFGINDGQRNYVVGTKFLVPPDRYIMECLIQHLENDGLEYSLEDLQKQGGCESRDFEGSLFDQLQQQVGKEETDSDLDIDSTPDFIDTAIWIKHCVSMEEALWFVFYKKIEDFTIVEYNGKICLITQSLTERVARFASFSKVILSTVLLLIEHGEVYYNHSNYYELSEYFNKLI